MKSRSLVLSLASLLVLAPAAPAQAPVATAEQLVANEHAFAAMARLKGTRSAFIEWLAPTGVIFRPGPVIGRRSWEARPDSKGWLAWDPDHAVMSASGDMGWTTGPWTFRADTAQTEALGHGQFVTLWRLQADGTWKAALDVGVSHDAANTAVVTRTLRTLEKPRVAGRSPLAARRTLWQADAEYVKRARAEGPAEALGAFGQVGVVVLREGAQRWIGNAARDSIAAREPSVEMMSTAQYMSQAGDLGYTYGTYVVPRGAESDSSHYVHIWERDESRTWKLALEIVVPLPKQR